MEDVTGSKLDKTALLAAGSFGLTYLDAKRLADEAGVDIGTEDQSTMKLQKQKRKKSMQVTYTNFFGGKKDGGRIGFSTWIRQRT